MAPHRNFHRQKTLMVFSLVVFLMSSLIESQAATLAGVTMPDTVQVGGKTLVLNGLGLRTKFMVKVYVGGLYLEQKSADSAAILKSDSAKQMVLHFVHSASKGQMSDAFSEGFDNNAPDARKTMKADIDRFLAALEPVKEGDQMVFTYVPGTGTTFSINNQDKLTIAGSAFAPALFAVWLGPKPPTADLKKGILGQ